MQPQNKVSERMIDGFSNFGEIIHRLEISFFISPCCKIFPFKYPQIQDIQQDNFLVSYLFIKGLKSQPPHRTQRSNHTLKTEKSVTL